MMTVGQLQHRIILQTSEDLNKNHFTSNNKHTISLVVISIIQKIQKLSEVNKLFQISIDLKKALTKYKEALLGGY